jgi:hypothetical protein
MREPVSDDVARGRWLMISLHRILGAALVVAGILAVEGVIGFGDVAGYVLIAVGLIDVFLVPRLLARLWRSPPG